VQSGRVISTNPDNGGSIPKGGTVTVNVSKGAANISLPNLQGVQASTAQAQLKSAGFTNVNEVSDTSSTLASGEVDHQSPAAGSYPPDQQITLYVSGGGIKVPSVVNDTAAVAQAILTQDGFTVNQTTTPASASQVVEPGTVYSQNPPANTVEPKGTLVQIFVQPQATSSPTPPPTDSTTPPPTQSPTVTPTTTAPTTSAPTSSSTQADTGGGDGQSSGAPTANS
jgi:eukaryotic-like serine/threonine-protein kinase